MKYNFDEIIDRNNTNSMKVSGFRSYLFPDLDDVKFPVSDDKLIKMWIADMDFATPQVVLDGIKAKLNDKILGYTKIFDDEYYQYFAQWTNDKYGWHCEKEHLVTSHGIVPALYDLLEIIGNENDKVLFITPSYAHFEHACVANKMKPVYSPLTKDSNGDFQLDFEDFANKAKEAQVIILCNPHNPTGIMWNEEELRKIGKIAQDNDVWLISDEIHCDLIRTNKKHIPMAKVMPEYDKIITAMAPSKTFNLAGMMISHIIIPNKDLMNKWNSTHNGLDNPLSIAASQTAYQHGAEWLEALKKYLDDNFKYLKEVLDKHLPKTNYNIPDATYLAWVDVSAYVPKDVDLTLWFAQEAGILLESGTQFLADGDGYVRLNLACPKAMLEDCLDKIIKLLNK